MKATLKDIAARVGVTSQLVSFYLNHPETTRVARETREKIDAAVKELNYRPNSVARALCTGKTGTIGLIMGGLNERKRGCYIHSLMNEAKRHSYHLLTAITNYSQQEEQEVLEYMMGRQVDGILYTLQLAPGNRISQRLRESHFPILMHAPQENENFNTIGHDCRSSLTAAVDALLARGHREITWLGTFHNEEEAFLRQLAQEKSFRLKALLITPDPEETDRLTAAVLRERPPAIMTFNVSFLRNLLEESEAVSPAYRPDCVAAYSLPFDWIRDERVIGVVHRFHKERTVQEISRMLEIIRHPEGEVKAIRLPTEYLAAGEIPALREKQLLDPYYKPFK